MHATEARPNSGGYKNGYKMQDADFQLACPGTLGSSRREINSAGALAASFLRRRYSATRTDLGAMPSMDAIWR